MKVGITAAILLQAAGIVTAGAPEPRGELQTEDVDTNSTFSLEAREEGHGRGQVLCGPYANADRSKALELIYILDNADRGKKYTIKPGQCDRVACQDTSALYVCNDNADPITLTGKQISISLLWVRSYCCKNGDMNGSSKNVLSGQQFTPWGWNSNVGYGNCNDPPSIRPHMAGGWGVNKETCNQLNYPDQAF